ncbi:MAG: hypothetical protein ACFFD4_30630 [Candidatus Odinarchaeota archaeon]
MKEIFDGFEKLKTSRREFGLGSDEVLRCIKTIFEYSLQYLNSCNRIELKSKVEGKRYFAFKSEKKITRAINSDVYETGLPLADKMFEAVRRRCFDELDADSMTAACYLSAISYCSAVDLLKSGDQKTPGTFFEYFIGHLYSRRLGIDPKKKIDVLNLDMQSTLPTDFIFDLGSNRAKFHLPVKTSTRERVIQVWAHQRLLDGVYGTGRFIGTLACMAETKTDKKKLEVVEICLPAQWRLYQMYIAQMKRIYYLDMPDAYGRLNTVFPKIPVMPFGHFFSEIDSLTQ